jgi:predicted secreted acid phosphatase
MDGTSQFYKYVEMPKGNLYYIDNIKDCNGPYITVLQLRRLF